MKNMAMCQFAAAAFAIGGALAASASVLVYDGMPVTGTGAYSLSGSPAKLCNQNPSHVSIVGETGIWGDTTTAGTGTINVSGDGLTYPADVHLLPVQGCVIMTHSATSATDPLRSVYRSLSSPSGGGSFYFSVLMAYSDLGNYRANDMALWGLTKMHTASGLTYPPSDGICVGFRKTASGVDAIVRVLNAVSVIRANVVPGTYCFAVRFDYNGAGNDTVSASLITSSEEPAVWDVAVSDANVLDAGQTLNYVHMGFYYPIASKWVKADEWRVGTQWAEIGGSPEAPPAVENRAASEIGLASARLNGTVTSTGTAATVVSVYYGATDGAGNPSAWEHAYTFPEPATAVPQDFSYLAEGLAAGAVHHYRYAVSNAVGFALASTSVHFQWQSPSVMVYDGFPVEGEGAYPGNNISLGTTPTTHLNPTNAFIIGTTNAWGGQDTGVFVSDSFGLAYPGGVNLAALEGALKMTHSDPSHPISSSYTRAMSRQLITPIAGKSFYFSTLMAYDGLSAPWVEGQYAVIGLTRSQAASASANYPPSDGVLFGFQRSAVGVDAVLRVMNQAYVLQTNVTVQTPCFFVGKFDYNPDGPDTVYASLATDSAAPSTWATNVTVEVLTPAQALNWLSVGCFYGMANGWAKADEWRTGETYSDVAGFSSASGRPVIANVPATNITDTAAWLNGTLGSEGASPATVFVCHGETDGGVTPAAWAHVDTLGVAGFVPQDFTFLATGLNAGTPYYFRYAASNEQGVAFASWTESFLPQPWALPVVTGPAAAAIQRLQATLTGQLTSGWPETAVWACLDTADRGTASTGSWARVEWVGRYTLPAALSYTVGGLLANGDYVFRFFSTNAVGGVWSDPATFSTLLPNVIIRDAYTDEGDEGLIPVSLPVELDVPSAKGVTVHYATENGTATGGVHYVVASGDLAIPAGVTATNLTVQIIANRKEEFPGRGFYVRLSAPSGAALSTSFLGETGILDDDMGQRLISESFDDLALEGTLPSGWMTFGLGNWAVRGQALKHADSGDGRAVKGDLGWSDYGVRAMMRIVTDWKSAGLYAYNRESVSEGTGYGFSFQRDNSYNAWYAALWANGSNIVKTSTGTISGARLGSPTVYRPAALRVTRTADGKNRVRCWIGQKLIFDVTDDVVTQTSGLPGIAGGKDTEVFFDRVEVFAAPKPPGTLVTVL